MSVLLVCGICALARWVAQQRQQSWLDWLLLFALMVLFVCGLKVSVPSDGWADVGPMLILMPVLLVVWGYWLSAIAFFRQQQHRAKVQQMLKLLTAAQGLSAMAVAGLLIWAPGVLVRRSGWGFAPDAWQVVWNFDVGGLTAVGLLFLAPVLLLTLPWPWRRWQGRHYWGVISTMALILCLIYWLKFGELPPVCALAPEMSCSG